MRIPVSTLLLSGLLVVFGEAQAQDHTLEQLVVEMASSAAEHNAVSQHYTAQAEAARQDMHRHQEMARIYSNAGRTGHPQMRQHCEQLAKKYGEIAGEFDELARLHAEEARKLTH